MYFICWNYFFLIYYYMYLTKNLTFFDCSSFCVNFFSYFKIWQNGDHQKIFFFCYRKNSAEVRKWPLISIQCINGGGFLCQQHTHTFPPPQWCPHHGQSPAHTRKPHPQTLLRTLLWLCYWSSQENGMHCLLW